MRYQLIHALALLPVGLWLRRPGPVGWLRLTTWLFVLGVGIFSGLLYALVWSGLKILGAVVPLGGVALIAGWLTLGIAALWDGPARADDGSAAG